VLTSVASADGERLTRRWRPFGRTDRVPGLSAVEGELAGSLLEHRMVDRQPCLRVEFEALTLRQELWLEQQWVEMERHDHGIGEA